MVLRFNNVHTRLAATIDDDDTTVTFDAALQEGGVNVPTLAGDTIILGIDDELLELTAYTAGATSGTVTRGYGDTLAAAHDAGAVVANVITKEDFVKTGATNMRWSDTPSFPAFSTASGVGEFLTETNGLDDSAVDGTGITWSDTDNRWDITVEGLYVIKAKVEWDSTAASAGHALLSVGVSNMGSFPDNQPSASEDWVAFNTGPVNSIVEMTRWLPAGTRITASVTQTSGGAMDVSYAEVVIKRLPV